MDVHIFQAVSKKYMYACGRAEGRRATEFVLQEGSRPECLIMTIWVQMLGRALTTNTLSVFNLTHIHRRYRSELWS
jgi:hypothetical protein